MNRALIVDDEYFVRKGLISTMPWEDFGIRIAGEASNGEKAIELLQRQGADLLITDLSMPVMNGFDLMRRVRDDFPQVCMVVLTCHEDFKYIQEALRLGAIDYIVKTELEDERMRESLGRISERLHEWRASKSKVWGQQEQSEASREAVVWSEEDEKKLQAHIEEWLPLHWAVKDAHFESLCRTMRGLNPPMPKLQKVMHYLFVEWNRMLGADFAPVWLQKAETAHNWAAWEAYMADFRNYLRQYLHISSYPQEAALLIMEAAQYIKANMDLKLTQHDIARKMNMSRGYFSKCFKNLLGRTFHDYMKELRIARAKTLLLQTSKPIADIAEECGFLDHRYFSRQFREETGLLPSEYRSSQV
ncbi:two-component system, response regulator YesN [Paenibacillus sp. UNCCL117]|uniref:response regulator transcription factor n=1 Tax=unclassified Paenibacillus TaxID=185978 RepID=UPI00088E951B|nr:MULTISPECIES: helix-turn-helix domain-containing protein [unclassified Paenibacillus]SDD51720.1 two component transcriptional regulator, AraC family [Paenibacillus sp. cl123]SFW49447.1 two-component system, response regulator YesN [Paenibacillus sp. UNCCL117]